MESTTQPQPRVGVGVFVINPEGKFLIGLRKGSHGSGTWGLPGGHLEFNETFEECGRRETLEETDLDGRDLKFLTATNNLMRNDGAHYVTVFMTCRVKGDTQPQVLEPEKCGGWQWVGWEQLKNYAREQKNREDKGLQAEKMLFLPLRDLFEHRPEINPLNME